MQTRESPASCCLLHGFLITSPLFLYIRCLKRTSADISRLWVSVVFSKETHWRQSKWKVCSTYLFDQYHLCSPLPLVTDGEHLPSIAVAFRSTYHYCRKRLKFKVLVIVYTSPMLFCIITMQKIYNLDHFNCWKLRNCLYMKEMALEFNDFRNL